MTFTFGSLFAGIGGLDLGLTRSGIENNDYCNRVLEKHWPEVKRYGDITKIDKSELEQVDLICGGFPCQPFSVAGQRKGTDDERWLWPEFRDTIRHVGPEWVLVENVPGLLSIDTGKIFAGILRDLAEMGFDAWWGSLRASDVGANHRRERVFIVAYTDITRRGQEQECIGGFKDKAITRNDGKKEYVADPEEQANGRGNTRESEGQIQQSGKCACSEDVPNPTSGGQHGEMSTGASQELRATFEGHSNWTSEPNVGRVADGVPNRVDRLRCIGNAVVPQCAEFIGRAIMEAAR